MSETSAVREVQFRCQREFKARGFFSVWGQPVQGHTSRKTGEATQRGHALGVALASSYPLHQPSVPLPEALASTQRLVEGMLRLGPVQVRVVAVYGFPSTYVEAGARNQQLLQMVLDQISQSRVPTIVGGDMNMSVLDLPIWEQFRHLGYRELFELYATRYGKVLPPTCRGSTRHDTVLLPPFLRALLQHARVDVVSKHFDAHDPLFVSFSKATSEVPRSWRMPKPWSDYCPDMQRATDIYDQAKIGVREVIQNCRNVDDVSAAFEYWAASLEDSVDQSIRRQHDEDPIAQPHKCLPRSARGRCVYRDKAPIAPVEVSPKAWAGGYDPVCEAMSMSSRRKVKQVRRLQALLQAIKAWHRKAAANGLHCCKLEQQLRAEWRTIRVNKAFGPRFDEWLLGFDQFGHVWWDVPPVPWLQDALQLAKHSCDAQVRYEAVVRSRRFRYLVQMDTLFGGQKQGFRQLRPKPRPPISCLPVTEVRDVVRVSTSVGATAVYEVDHPQFLRLHCPVFSTAGDATVDQILPETDGERADWAQLTFSSGQAPHRCRITQHTQAVTCEELHREFVEYWTKIWLRDSWQDSLTLENWPSFLAQLPPRPEGAHQLDLPLLDVSVWEAALRKLRPHRATGYDGFSPSELKSLRGRALEDLVLLYDQVVQHGFPTHLSRSCPVQSRRPEVVWGRTAHHHILHYLYREIRPCQVVSLDASRDSRRNALSMFL